MAKIVLPVPEEKKVKLNLTLDEDPTQEAYVVVRQATVAEQERLATLSSNDSREYLPGGSVRVQSSYNMLEMYRTQCYITLTDCNLFFPDPEFPDDENKYKPLFTFHRDNGRMCVVQTTQEFKDQWGKLPSTWAEKIIEAVWSVNPQWDTNKDAGE